LPTLFPESCGGVEGHAYQPKGCGISKVDDACKGANAPIAETGNISAEQVSSPVRKIALVTDPPYGILEITGDAVKGRKNPKWGMWGSDREWDADVSAALPLALSLASEAIVWGGNYYDLPPKRGWLIWDK